MTHGADSGETPIKLFRLSAEHLIELVALEGRVSQAIPNSEWLRDNDKETFEACLQHHHTFGAYTTDNELVAVVILFDAGTGHENIKSYLTDRETDLLQAINLKLVLVEPTKRRFGLGRTLIEFAEIKAAELGKREVLCTIHRDNTPSVTLFSGLGYQREVSVSTPYGERDVYVKRIAVTGGSGQ